MLAILLSLHFSSSFVPLCVQYDYQKTAFHCYLVMKTLFVYVGLGRLAVMVLKIVMRCT